MADSASIALRGDFTNSATESIGSMCSSAIQSPACTRRWPMLCIVGSTADDLDPVDGRPVRAGCLWDTPPSSWPITGQEIVEFQFDTTDADAAAAIEVIASTLEDRVGGWARWQILDPVRLDGEASGGHLGAPQPQRCDVVVSVGIRGEGDLGEIDEDIQRAMHHAGLRMGSSMGAGYPFGAERERVLGKYSELRDSSDDQERGVHQ